MRSFHPTKCFLFSNYCVAIFSIVLRQKKANKVKYGNICYINVTQKGHGWLIQYYTIRFVLVNKKIYSLVNNGFIKGLRSMLNSVIFTSFTLLFHLREK